MSPLGFKAAKEDVTSSSIDWADVDVDVCEDDYLIVDTETTDGKQSRERYYERINRYSI